MPKGYRFSEETKRILSAQKMGAKNPMFGKRSWNSGHCWSKKMRKRMSDAHKGRSYISIFGEKRAKEVIDKIRNANKNQVPWMKGKHHDLETRLRISKKLSGSKAPNWMGGLSFEPYGFEFNRLLREEIRQRDSYRCQNCFCHQLDLRTLTDKPYKLNVHHIDYDKKNNNPKNLISLCRKCHLKTNFNRIIWKKKFYAQITILESGLMAKEEIFLPYIYSHATGNTLYQALAKRDFNVEQLEYKEADDAANQKAR
jgi:hypothetical protein